MICRLGMFGSRIISSFGFLVEAALMCKRIRFKWKQYPDAPDHHDVAIWENRSVYHTATDDYFDADGAVRTGDRVVSLGEKPYYDESGKSRRDALELNEFAGQQF